MENYFKKHLQKFMVYLLLAGIFAIAALMIVTHKPFNWKILMVATTMLLIIFFIKSIGNFTSYITRTVPWNNSEDFWNKINNAPCLFKRIRPDDKDGFSHRYYDIEFEVFGTDITLSKVPVFYKKEIEKVSASSNMGLFSVSIRYGPNKGGSYKADIIIR